MNKGKLFIVSAPSGAGKTTLVHLVIEHLQDTYQVYRAITYTTKKPRSSETQGIDYHFITESEFKEKIGQGFFIEYSTAYGAYYGFPHSVVAEVEKGTHYIAVLDRAGAEALKAHKPDVVLIWIKPPTRESLQVRLATRAQDSEEAIAYRLALAEKEMVSEEQSNFYHHVIVNDDLAVAVEELASIMRDQLD